MLAGKRSSDKIVPVTSSHIKMIRFSSDPIRTFFLFHPPDDVTNYWGHCTVQSSSHPYLIMALSDTSMAV
uniref:Uncharacterized protein n=1 Tax=Magallana gigas TaxID=29159 RepID=K1QEW9_MAGGI